MAADVVHRGREQLRDPAALLLPLLPESAHGDLWRIAVGFGAFPALVVLSCATATWRRARWWAANRGDLRGAARILRKSYGADVEISPDAPPPKPAAGAG